MGVVTNQYTDIIPQEWFKEYKDASEERKQEIEDEFFRLVRTVNEVPKNDFNLENQIASLRLVANVDSYDVYKNGEYYFQNFGIDVLNDWFPSLNDVRKKGCPLTITEGFHTDRILKRVIKKTLTYSDSVLDIYRWLRMCGVGYCVNYRPASAKALYEIFGRKENCRVLDPSSGYGARMLGAHFAKNVVEYVGIDPNTADDCMKLAKFLDKYYDTETKKTVYKMGSEDFTLENFPQYQNYFDLSFTSPPYFDTERYSEDENQSYKKFPTYAGWVKGFYQQTIYNCIDALKPDGILAINIFEKVPNICELTKLFAANKGFYIYKRDKYLLRTMPGKAGTDEDGKAIKRDRSIGKNFEPVWYFKHFEVLREEGLINDDFYRKCLERAGK